MSDQSKQLNKEKFAWHKFERSELLDSLDSDVKMGLSASQVQERLSKYGENKFQRQSGFSIVERIVDQFKSPLVFILIIAGIVTLLLGEILDTSVIFAAVIINIGIGVFQEGRASKAFQKLNSSQEKYARVIRGGQKKTIPASELVPGDICILEAGSTVPADIRLLEAKEMITNESALTGESAGVNKDTNTLDGDIAISDMKNIAWMGTLVASGVGRGVVVETGQSTQIGEIAGELIGKDEITTPLQEGVKKLANFLLFVVLGALVLIFIIGILRGESLQEMALLSIAIAVSAIPEGLPAAVTVVLAIGMEAILKKKGLVRNLLAAETLGSTDFILTDKTGTLTQARMELATLATYKEIHDFNKRSKFNEIEDRDLESLMRMAILTSDAYIERGEGGREVVKGRPLERAVLEAGLSFELNQDELMESAERLDYIPFSSARRFEVSLNVAEGAKSRALYFSGSPETLLGMSNFVMVDGESKELTKEHIEFFESVLEKKASQGMRFISIAYKKVDWEEIPRNENSKEKISDEVEEGVVFVGLLAFSDPIREDVLDAMDVVQSAGARVVMLTGDHPETASFIAREAGIRGASAGFVMGTEVEEMSDEELLATLNEKSVFARMIPSAKLRIANLLRNEGHVVAMTGDGVNDAPALRFADIGVAVGSGTDVAKESSDLVLLDNSFATIVRAVEEGRRIIDNLKKVVSHLISTSFGEVIVIAGAIAFALPLPVLPVQIIWLNIIEEGFLNFAFAFEPKEEGVMKRDPKKESQRSILTPAIKKLILIVGVLSALTTFALFVYLVTQTSVPIEEIRTVIFAALSLDAMFFALSLKNLHRPIWKENFFNNLYLIGAVSLSFVLLLLTLSVPFMRKLLSLTPLSGLEILVLVGIGLFDLILIETAKYFLLERRDA